MTKIKQLVALAVALAWMVGSAGSVVMAQADDIPVAIEIVLDSSQQMKTIIGEEKISEILNKDLSKFFKRIPANVPVAIRTFGHRVGTRQKPKSCQDTELIHPLAAIEGDQVASQIGKLTTKGYSPLAYSLKKVPSDVPDLENNRLILVLISASGDSCNGDAVSAVRQLKSKNTEMAVYVINLFGQSDVKNELMSLAEVSDSGKIWDVTAADEMEAALNNLSIEIAKVVGEAKASTSEPGKNTENTDTGNTAPDNNSTGATTPEDTVDDTPVDEIEDLSGSNSINEGNSETQDEFSVLVYDFVSSSLFIYLAAGLGVVVVLAVITKIVVSRKEQQFPAAVAPPAAPPAVPQAPVAPIVPMQSPLSAPPTEKLAEPQSTPTIKLPTAPPQSSGENKPPLPKLDTSKAVKNDEPANEVDNVMEWTGHDPSQTVKETGGEVFDLGQVKPSKTAPTPVETNTVPPSQPSVPKVAPAPSPAAAPTAPTEPSNTTEGGDVGMLKLGDIELPKLDEKDAAVSLDRMIEPEPESNPPTEPPATGAGGIKITPSQ